MSTLAKHIAREVYRCRTERKWTQEYLAARVKVSTSTICRIEKEESLPDAEVLLNLSLVFECSILVFYPPKLLVHELSVPMPASAIAPPSAMADQWCDPSCTAGTVQCDYTLRPHLAPIPYIAPGPGKHE